jgi:hypothetical protein
MCSHHTAGNDRLLEPNGPMSEPSGPFRSDLGDSQGRASLPHGCGPRVLASSSSSPVVDFRTPIPSSNASGVPSSALEVNEGRGCCRDGEPSETPRASKFGIPLGVLWFTTRDHNRNGDQNTCQPST